MNGVFLVDKPEARTSHDVVKVFRKFLCQREVGHAGSLDPMATGLLIILAGEGTKLSQVLTGCEKTYDARIVLGVETDTHDRDGKVIRRLPVNVKEEDINKAFEELKGENLQVPPHFSALKYRGKPLYKYARKGIAPEINARNVCIYALQVKGYTKPYVEFSLTCSKGTYVRAIARDIGERLGCGAHLDYLRRLSIGSFSVEDALRLDDLEMLGTDGLSQKILPLSDALPGWAPVQVDRADISKVRNGNIDFLQRLVENQVSSEERKIKFVSDKGLLLAIAERKTADSKMEIVRVLNVH